MAKKISVLIPCYNEEENVHETYKQIKEQMEIVHNQKEYDYEIIWIDNASTDRTVQMLKEIAKTDKQLKIIVNARNAGFVRSCHHGLLQCYGDAVIFIEADLQTPPPMIQTFIDKWEEGYKVVAGVKASSKENPIMFAIRKMFYSLLAKSSETQLIKNFLGVGLYDQSFIETLRSIDDPFPYFRGMVSELGTDIITIPYDQQVRTRGKSAFNLYKMFDVAMLGFVNQTKLPIRLATFIGLIMATLSMFLAIWGVIYKILNWDSFDVGMAGLSVGMFFFASIQLIFLGIIGEYISAIFIQVRKRPLVIERERVNFEDAK
jgi:glycosyltransferase involved in cell wall biosynthesis